MYTQTSHHIDSIRRRSQSYFSKSREQPTKYRPALNVHKLIKKLKKTTAGKNGKAEVAPSRKRSASPMEVEDAHAKRRRFVSPAHSQSDGSQQSDNELDDEQDEGEDAEMKPAEDIDEDAEDSAEDSDDPDFTTDDWEWGEFPRDIVYPMIDPAENLKIQQSDEASSQDAEPHQYIPVFQHTFEMAYTTNIPDEGEEHYINDHIAAKRGWDKEEAELRSVLGDLGEGITEPLEVDLGRVWICRYQGHYVGLSSYPEEVPARTCEEAETESAKWFLCIPHLHWPQKSEVDFDADDYTPAELHDDMFEAFGVLGGMGGVLVETNLRCIILPSSAATSTSELPFRICIDINAFLVTPTIFNSPITGTRREIARMEDAHRRFISFVFPPPPPKAIPSPSAASDSSDIPFLYSILKPAPRLPSTLAEEAMQPEALLPTLLPFQRRSVGWMLEKEGKTITAQGEIRPKSHDLEDTRVPLFWYKAEPQGWYIHRLTGYISPGVPEGYDDPAQGGILAEEPGLGKTLECMALVMLNPAPGRNPSISRWVEESRITLKEIKTTLIVTPPALASQWFDEFALHAPSLKVFVYDGWSKLKVPITPYDVERERERRRSGGRVKVEDDGSPKPKKGAKRRGKGKAKLELDDDYMDVDSASTSTSAFDGKEEVEEIQDWCEFINTFDVCITTYNTLRLDLDVARAPPVRPRREDVVYSSTERARSPLVMCEWTRVIMDEVQMVGGGKTEQMVSLIPRISSFAVSGTPARTQVNDLKHVIKFLRIEDLIGPQRLWERLQRPGFADQFAALFQEHAIRTMKSTVKDELTIPQQTRYLVGIDLGPVERHVYDQSLELALRELGLDARGVAASAGWEIDPTLLRSSIRRLRGLCTHPQVGQLQRQGENLMKPGALKSMGEVLEAMKDQNWRNLMDDRKLKVQTLTVRAQMMQRNDDDATRYRIALETLQLAEKEADELIAHIKAAIADHAEEGEVLKKDAEAARESRKQDSHEDADPNDKGKAAERDFSPTSDADSEDHDLPKTPAGQEHGNKRRALQQRLREGYVTLHKVKFLQGDVYHVLGQSHSADEDAAYAAADDMRKSLLQTTQDSATRAMAILQKDAAAKGLTEESLMIDLPFCEQGGIRSHMLMEEANELIEELLNEQSELIWKWRTRMHSLLTQSLKADGQADGEEYSRSLDAQGEADMYIQAYTALLADRRAALVAERTLLAAHDGKEKKLRKTRAADKATAAAAAVDALNRPEIREDVELQPEHEVLFKELTNTRRALLEDFNDRAIKSIVVELNTIGLGIKNEKDPEKILVKEAVKNLRKLMVDQGTLMDKLDADLAQFRRAFNERILYFRQLQEISDSVAEAAWDGRVVDAINETVKEQAELEIKINTSRARQRFLNHLAKNQEDGAMDEEDECCILCKCEFKRGYITTCAHVFCEPCMNAWIKRADGKTCPVCRVAIHANQLQRFTVDEKNKEEPPPPLPTADEPAPRTKREIQYNKIASERFEEIQTIESYGSYGTKIQTLVRHLLYLQIQEPGAKSIVFSAWADSLHIIEHALKRNGIPCLRIDQGGGKNQNAAKRFRSDPEVLVLLLHGERENAGLNVTCASRVFLVESVVHHGFELQAIARIDRMGQTRPTEVFCYYAEETVEKNILDLAARQKLSLYTKDNSAGTLNVTPFALDAEKKTDSPSKGKKNTQKGDFINKTDDMLAILFPHMFFYEDYMDTSELTTHSDSHTIQAGPSNAIAGPSSR